MRVLLVTAYDGTAYHGWQDQPGRTDTIEGQLNRCISELTGEDTAVIGASRTDAGVHALGNVAVFDTGSSIPAEKFAAALNGRLPWDIRIIESYRVDDDFHPRHMDTRKTYLYRIYHGAICPPQERLYAHHVYGPVDTEAMKEAAGGFVGEHDFSAFCAAGSQAATTVRTIYDCRVSVKDRTWEHSGKTGTDTCIGDELIEIRVTGSGFLYNMVRIIAGTLLEVGRGHISPGDISSIIEKGERSGAGPTLPPMGLFLEKYEW